MLRRSNVKNSSFDRTCFGYRLFDIRRTHFGCRIFDIRRTANRMTKIRHPKKGDLDVEYTTFDGVNIGSKIESNNFAHL